MDNSYQHSTIAQILENILEEFVFEGESRSDIADILLSILNKTEYNKETDSVIADLLIRLKAKIEGESYDPYDAAYTSRIAEILISILEETEYTEEPQSRIAELLLQLKEELEAYTELTASGSIASFITNVVKPLVNGEFTIQAYQEGTGDPSPVNVRNIVPRREVNIYQRGINQWNEEWELGVYDTSTGAKTETTNRVRNKNFISIKGGAFYYVYCGSNASFYLKPLFYDADKNYIGTISSVHNAAIIPPANACYMNFYMNDVYGVPYNNNISINYPSTDTSYHAYDANSNDKVVNLGEDTYGAVYNSVTGGKENTHDFVDMGTLDYVYASFGGINYFRSLTTINADYANEDYICEALKAVTYSRGVYGLDSDKTFFINTNLFIYLRDDSYTDATALKTAYNGKKIKFKLATPTETQLDPTPINTFNGDNNIFCDTGDTSVTYLYKGTPPETLTRAMSKSPVVEDIIKEEELKDLKDLDELQELDISEKEGL